MKGLYDHGVRRGAQFPGGFEVCRGGARFAGGHEVCRGGIQSRQDEQRGPELWREDEDELFGGVDVMDAATAKEAWLQRKLAALQNRMERETRHGARLHSRYWSERFGPSDRHGDRAQQDCGRGSDRAQQDCGRGSDRAQQDCGRSGDRAQQDGGRSSDRAQQDGGRSSDRVQRDNDQEGDLFGQRDVQGGSGVGWKTETEGNNLKSTTIVLPS